MSYPSPAQTIVKTFYEQMQGKPELERSYLRYHAEDDNQGVVSFVLLNDQGLAQARVRVTKHMASNGKLDLLLEASWEKPRETMIVNGVEKPLYVVSQYVPIAHGTAAFYGPVFAGKFISEFFTCGQDQTYDSLQWVVKQYADYTHSWMRALGNAAKPKRPPPFENTK